MRKVTAVVLTVSSIIFAVVFPVWATVLWVLFVLACLFAFAMCRAAARGDRS